MDVNVYKCANKPGTAERFKIICMECPCSLNRMIQWYPSQRDIAPTIHRKGNWGIAFGRYCSDGWRFYKWKKSGQNWIRKVCRQAFFFSSTLLWLIYKSACPTQATGLVHKVQIQFIIFAAVEAWMEKIILQIFILVELMFIAHFSDHVYLLSSSDELLTVAFELNHIINTVDLTLVNYFVL